MEPTLYILMRNDLASMNPGKAIAQGSHATNIFERELVKWSSFESDHGTWIGNMVDIWRGDRDFGRCLTVAVKGNELDCIMQIIEDTSYIGGVVCDPTYPISDGEVTHHIPLETCGYVFVWEPDNGAESYFVNQVKKLELYK